MTTTDTRSTTIEYQRALADRMNEYLWQYQPWLKDAEELGRFATTMDLDRAELRLHWVASRADVTAARVLAHMLKLDVTDSAVNGTVTHHHFVAVRAEGFTVTLVWLERSVVTDL